MNRAWSRVAAFFSALLTLIGVFPVLLTPALGSNSFWPVGPVECEVPSPLFRCPLWASVGDRVDDHGFSHGLEYPTDIAVSPDSKKVFVTGTTWTNNAATDLVTAAYDAEGGQLLWEVQYNGPLNTWDWGVKLAVGLDGHLVYVVATLDYTFQGRSDLAVFAYEASTGILAWTARYDTPGSSIDGAAGLALSPDGERVFVIASSYRQSTGYDITTLSIDSATGDMKWVEWFASPGQLTDYPIGVAAGSDGRVFVAGGNLRPLTVDAGGGDYIAFAYRDDRENERAVHLWSTIHDGGRGLPDLPKAMGVSPDGSLLFVTGLAQTVESQNQDCITCVAETVAYAASTGTVVWSASYGDPAGLHIGYDLAVAPNGTQIYVTGVGSPAAETGGAGQDAVLLAYGLDGSLSWSATEGLPGRADLGLGVTTSPDGERVYVGGAGITQFQGEFLTVAYNADGSRVWAARYNTGPAPIDWSAGFAISAGPDGNRVFVAGMTAYGITDDPDNWYDRLTLAYDA